MAITDSFPQQFVDSVGEQGMNILRAYESVYPPDISMRLSTTPSVMDFTVEGGDIAVAGFYVNATLESVVHLATQDLIYRVLTDKGDSVLFPDDGGINIFKLPRETIESSVSISAYESPYISKVVDVRVTETAIDEITVTVDALTPTGEKLGIGLGD
jgi:hypothetical protein